MFWFSWFWFSLYSKVPLIYQKRVEYSFESTVSNIELSEFVWPSPSPRVRAQRAPLSSQNLASLVQSSVSSLFQKIALKTAFRPVSRFNEKNRFKVTCQTAKSTQHPHKIDANITSAKLGVVCILPFSEALTIRTPPPPSPKYHLMKKVFCGDGAWFVVPWLGGCFDGPLALLRSSPRGVRETAASWSGHRPRWLAGWIALDLVSDTIDSQEENPPEKINTQNIKFIWTSFSEQFPLGSWLLSQGNR